MDSSTGCSSFFHVTTAVRVFAVVLPGVVLGLVSGPRASAQLLDSTVQQQVEEQVESDVTGTVEDEVQQQVESDVTGTVEDEVRQQVESDVTGTVEDEVQQQVESDVTGTVEDQVQQQVESDVTGTVENQVQQQVESGVTSTVEQQVESGVVDSIERQVESGVTETAESDAAVSVREAIERQLESLLGDEFDGGLVDQLAELAEDLGIDDVGAAIETAVERSGQIAGDGGGAGSGGEDADAGAASEDDGAERYVAGVDALGRAAESDVWVILVPAQFTARIQDWGFTVREQQDLDVLDRVLLRVDAPEERDIAQAALELALAAPGTSVDFNHVYRANQGTRAAGATEAAGRLGASAARPRNASLDIGIVDSKIAADHESLARADITQRDFVPFAGTRPTAHGTAIASILVGNSPARAGVLAGARLHAATVFFEDEAGEQIATTSSLIGALEWLVARGVRVANMSLAGPPNRVLESAIGAAAERDALVVAAVGNNGPSGEPLYPAAYERVVGVTAVDAAYRVYAYANRGGHVMFSAPGVDVPVAVGEGGYAKQSGTSMASPHAAAVIAKALAAQAASADDVLARLKAHAVDLGEADFDDVYGFGLIAAID